MISTLMPLIADLHRNELLAEAEAERRARLALGASPATPAWRRLLGRAIGTMSVALGAIARWLDPATSSGTSGARARRFDLVH
jgi:hypothetical protein